MWTIITSKVNCKVSLYSLSIIINLLISVKLCIHIFIDAKLQVGLITHQKTKSLLDEGHVADLKVSTFYKGVRAFFEKAVKYSFQNLPLDDALLQNACFVNFEQRISADSLQPEYFVSRCVLYNVICIIVIN